MNIAEVMKNLVEPESVAIVGATRKSGDFSMNIMEHILSYGYTGKLYPINPNAGEILGVKAYADISGIADPIDLALIVTARDIVPGVLRSCAHKGIKCAIIVAQGFSDAMDNEGHALNRQLTEIVRTTGIRVLGPNTFGTANAFINFSTSFARIKLDKNPVGIVCQSGLFFHGLPEFRLTGKCIDLGNACDIGFTEALDYFENDPQVKVIGLHIEGVNNPQVLLKTMERVTAKKPVIVLKTGRSEQAARAMQSHTGSLAGNSLLWDSALKRAGAIRVSDIEEFFDTVRMFSMAPLMKNNKIVVATFSGAAGILAMDAMRDTGLEIGNLSEDTIAKLVKLAPAWLKVGNPVDYWPIMMGYPDQGRAMSEVMEILLSDDEIGGVMFTQVAFTPKFDEMMAMFLNYLAGKFPHKPFMSAISGTYNGDFITGLQQDGKHLAFHTPERTATAFSHLWQYSRLRRRL
ncbi:MAG: CoA-binding protein [Chloroflexi bacterium]|nr:CoA-binding protein [Chloroflexota bacterium]